jgi:spermidine/putrescine-binding protein
MTLRPPRLASILEWRVIASIAVFSAISLGIWFWKASTANSRPRALELLIWQDYMSPELVARFQKEFDCKVNVSYFSSNEDLLDILRNESRPDVDVIVPSSYSLGILQQEAFLEPVTTKRSQAWNDMDQELLKRFDLTQFKTLGIPYMIAPTGIASRKTTTNPNSTTPPISWSILFDKKNHHQQLSILDDKREAIAISLLSEGKPCVLTDEKSISDACKHIKEALDNGTIIDASAYHYKLINGDLQIAQAWPGDVIPFENYLIFQVPEEGHVVTCDFLCVLRSSGRKKLAWSFVNYFSRPDIASQNMEWCQYRSPVRDAYRNKKASLKHPALHLEPTDGKPYKGFVLPSVSREVDDMINQHWIGISK